MAVQTYKRCLEISSFIRENIRKKTVSDALLTRIIEKLAGCDPKTIIKYKKYLCKFDFLRQLENGSYEVVGNKAK